jgi:hypothetical protein
MRGLAGPAPTSTVGVCAATAVPRVHLKLSIAVKRPPRHKGRLVISARCSSGCRICVELRVPPSQRRAVASGGSGAVRRTTGYRAGRQTLSVNLAKRIARGAVRVKLKVVAIDRRGLRTTRTRTLRVSR